MAVQAQAITWETSLPQSEACAAREGKPVLIDFSAAPECKGCVAMDTVSYPDFDVARFIELHCVAAKARVKENRHLADDYLVSWTPNVVLVDDRGRIHDRVEGYLPPKHFTA